MSKNLSRQLFKYDFKWIFGRVTFIYLGITLVLVILTQLTSGSTSFIGQLLYRIGYQLALIALLSTIITTITRSIARYRRNLYKDEAYLTHTLPVTRRQLFDSKVLAAIAVNFITVLALAGCIFIACDQQTLNNLGTLLSADSTRPLVILFVIAALSQLVCLLLSAFIGITAGYKSDNHKGAKATIFTIIAYAVVQLVMLGIIYLVGRFVPTIGDLFSSAPRSVEDVTGLFYLIVTIYLVFDIAYYLLGKHLLNKGVDLD